MALIECSECKRQISSAATVCPGCGHPVTGGGGGSSYHAQQPGLELRPIGILLGLVLIASGLYLALSFIPEHDPANIISSNLPKTLYNLNRWYLNPNLVGPLKVVAWVLVVLGVAELLTGSTTRSGKLVYCKACDTQVVAKSAFMGSTCERCGQRV
jgi:hypothetical protein